MEENLGLFFRVFQIFFGLKKSNLKKQVITLGETSIMVLL